MIRGPVTVAVATVMLSLIALDAAAQNTADSGGAWMFELYGSAFGDVLDVQLPGSWGSGGTVLDSFPAGQVFSAGNVPNGVSRAVPSWIFGDGARLFEEARRALATRAANPVSLPAILPLDAVLGTRGTVSTASTAFGGRLSRRIASRLWAELAVDRGQVRVGLDSSTTAGIEATRASYANAFGRMAEFVDPTRGGRVSSVATYGPEPSGNQTVVTGSAVLALVKTSRLGIHAILGGGVALSDAAETTVALQSGYQFELPPVVVDERESVTVRFRQKDRAPVAVAGLGFTLRLAGRSGVRVDARVLAVGNTSSTTVDASAPEVASRGTLTFGGISPTLRFGLVEPDRGSLSGAPVNELATYRGGGRDLRPQVTVGYFVRF